MAGGFTQSTRIPVPANGTSAVIFAPVLSWVSVDPAPGVSVEVEWTRDTLAAINANTATWANWNLGVISNSSTNKRDTPELNCYVRAVTTVTSPSNSTTCTLEVLANPGALIPELTPQWQSQGNTGGGGGGGVVGAWWITPSFATTASIQDAVNFALANGKAVVLSDGVDYIAGATDTISIVLAGGDFFQIRCFGKCAILGDARTDITKPMLYWEQPSNGGMMGSEINGINFSCVAPPAAGFNANAYALKITGATGTRVKNCHFDAIQRGLCLSNSHSGGTGSDYYTEQIFTDHCHFHVNCQQQVVIERAGGPFSFHGTSFIGGTVFALNSNFPGITMSGSGVHVYGGRLDIEIFNNRAVGPTVFIDVQNGNQTPQDFAGGMIHIEGKNANLTTMCGLNTEGNVLPGFPLSGTVTFTGGSIYADSPNIYRLGNMVLADDKAARPDGSSALIKRIQQGAQSLIGGQSNPTGFNTIDSCRMDAASVVYIRLTTQHTYLTGVANPPTDTYENRYKLVAGRVPFAAGALNVQVEAIISEADPLITYVFLPAQVNVDPVNTIDILAGGASILPGRLARLSAPGGAPTGLVDGGYYYIIATSVPQAGTVTIQLADTYDHSISNPVTPMTLTGIGVAPMSLQVAPLGNVTNGGLDFTTTSQGQLNVIAPGLPEFSVICEYEIHQLGETGATFNTQPYSSLQNNYVWFSNDTWVDTGTSIITCYWPHDTLVDGMEIIFTTTGTAPAGLVPADATHSGKYFVRAAAPTGRGLTFYPTLADAIALPTPTNQIILTTTGAGHFFFNANRG